MVSEMKHDPFFCTARVIGGGIFDKKVTIKNSKNNVLEKK
jgi:hypothetical protein